MAKKGVGGGFIPHLGVVLSPIWGWFYTHDQKREDPDVATIHHLSVNRCARCATA